MVDARSGASLVKQSAQAYMFSSAAVAGDVVLMGVLNGTLQARDFDSGRLLWTFTTEASRRNRGWVLTAEGAFNGPMIYATDWREAAFAATELQFSVGSFFSSPLVAGGVIYVGSADGRLYALE